MPHNSHNTITPTGLGFTLASQFQVELPRRHLEKLGINASCFFALLFPPGLLSWETVTTGISARTRCCQVGKDCRLSRFLLGRPAWRERYALPGRAGMPGRPRASPNRLHFQKWNRRGHKPEW